LLFHALSRSARPRQRDASLAARSAPLAPWLSARRRPHPGGGTLHRDDQPLDERPAALLISASRGPHGRALDQGRRPRTAPPWPGNAPARGPPSRLNNR